MKLLASILAALALSGSGPPAKELRSREANRPPPHECQPYAEICPACKDCTACHHCHDQGGKCSVCFKK